MESYKLMMYINSILLTIVGLLFGAVAWYFKKDYDSNKQRVDIVESNVEKILLEMKEDREREKGQATLMMNMIKILAKKTNTEIGL